jgi:hypothetical protein
MAGVPNAPVVPSVDVPRVEALAIGAGMTAGAPKFETPEVPSALVVPRVDAVETGALRVDVYGATLGATGVLTEALRGWKNVHAFPCSFASGV